MKYETDSQLLRAAADSIEMQAAAGLEPKFKADGRVRAIAICNLIYIGADIEFPRTILEGKLVWIGDVAYFGGRNKRTAREDGWYDEEGRRKCQFGELAQRIDYTWTPPTPSIPEGFTPWHGGKWTGHPKGVVERYYRDGSIGASARAEQCDWEHGGNYADIIGYRIIKKYEEPKTVMVELSVKAVRSLLLDYQIRREATTVVEAVAEAFRKALEGLK